MFGDSLLRVQSDMELPHFLYFFCISACFNSLQIQTKQSSTMGNIGAVLLLPSNET